MSGEAMAEGWMLLAGGASDGGGMTPTSVTPGVAGYLVVFVLSVATLLLILDMTRRVRRMQARERVAARHRAEAEVGASAAAEASTEDLPRD